MKIAHRLLLAQLPLVTCLLLSAALATRLIDDLTRTIRADQSHYHEIVAAATEVSSFAKRAEGHLLLYLTLHRQMDRDKFAARCGALDEQLSQLQKLPLDRAGRERLEAIMRQRPELDAAGQELLAAHDRDLQAGGTFLPARHVPAVVRLNDAVSAIRQQGVDLAKHAAAVEEIQRQQTLTTLAWSRQTIVVFTLGIGIAAVLLSMLLARSIAAPLRAIAAAARQIGCGSLATRVAVRGRDELATLGQALNAMAGSLQLMYQRLTNDHARLAAANQQLRAHEQQLQASQESLIRAERLSATGKLASGVAHEFNNVLGIIRAHAQLLESDAAVDADARRMLDVIIGQTRRGAEVAAGIMALARPSPLQRRAVDLAELTRQVLALQRKQLELENIRVELRLTDGLVSMADPGKLQQVLLNLIINARHAMLPARGGTLTVAAEAAAGMAQIHVKDTGVGMDEETRHRIFTPFFTTKGASADNALGVRGSGLGLAVSYMIMQEHGGSIDVISAPGAGTTFTLLLPLIAA